MEPAIAELIERAEQGLTGLLKKEAALQVKVGVLAFYLCTRDGTLMLEMK